MTRPIVGCQEAPEGSTSSPILPGSSGKMAKHALTQRAREKGPRIRKVIRS